MVELSREEYTKLEKDIESGLAERYLLLSKAKTFTFLVAAILGLGAWSWFASVWEVETKWSDFIVNKNLDQKLSRIDAAVKLLKGVENGSVIKKLEVVADDGKPRARIYSILNQPPDRNGTYLELLDSDGHRQFLISALDDGQFNEQVFDKSGQATMLSHKP
jgi:hypothetical protein